MSINLFLLKRFRACKGKQERGRTPRLARLGAAIVEVRRRRPDRQPMQRLLRPRSDHVGQGGVASDEEVGPAEDLRALDGLAVPSVADGEGADAEKVRST